MYRIKEGIVALTDKCEVTLFTGLRRHVLLQGVMAFWMIGRNAIVQRRFNRFRWTNNVTTSNTWNDAETCYGIFSDCFVVTKKIPGLPSIEVEQGSVKVFPQALIRQQCDQVFHTTNGITWETVDKVRDQVVYANERVIITSGDYGYSVYHIRTRGCTTSNTPVHNREFFEWKGGYIAAKKNESTTGWCRQAEFFTFTWDGEVKEVGFSGPRVPWLGGAETFNVFTKHLRQGYTTGVSVGEAIAFLTIDRIVVLTTDLHSFITFEDVEAIGRVGNDIMIVQHGQPQTIFSLSWGSGFTRTIPFGKAAMFTTSDDKVLVMTCPFDLTTYSNVTNCFITDRVAVLQNGEHKTVFSSEWKPLERLQKAPSPGDHALLASFRRHGVSFALFLAVGELTHP